MLLHEVVTAFLDSLGNASFTVVLFIAHRITGRYRRLNMPHERVNADRMAVSAWPKCRVKVGEG